MKCRALSTCAASCVGCRRACSKAKSPHNLEHGRYMAHFLFEIPDVETLGNAHCSSVYVMHAFLHLPTLITQPNFFMLFCINFHQNTKDYHTARYCIYWLFILLRTMPDRREDRKHIQVWVISTYKFACFYLCYSVCNQETKQHKSGIVSFKARIHLINFAPFIYEAPHFYTFVDFFFMFFCKTEIIIIIVTSHRAIIRIKYENVFNNFNEYCFLLQ